MDAEDGFASGAVGTWDLHLFWGEQKKSACPPTKACKIAAAGTDREGKGGVARLTSEREKQYGFVVLVP